MNWLLNAMYHLLMMLLWEMKGLAEKTLADRTSWTNWPLIQESNFRDSKAIAGQLMVRKIEQVKLTEILIDIGGARS